MLAWPIQLEYAGLIMQRALLALMLLLLWQPQPSEAFVFRKIVYCSPVEGLVHWAGKPLANVTVTRELYSGGFKDNRFEDSTTSSASGAFSMPAVEERRLFRPNLLSSNPTISQMMWITHDNYKYLFWSYGKHDFWSRSESMEGVLKIDCDLSTFEESSPGRRIVRCKHNGVRYP
ncbi:DUF6795 domain-containing protein [Limnobacter sp.]|uniref:DUF6795 domain-containing protein n=1 Tax=Limnobacter sp. TaxID=2003368 RepID=UPI003515809C